MKRTFGSDYRWEGVDLLAYKENGGTHFRSITRQTLFEGREDLPSELRYFEIEPLGYSTLERHEHIHVVMILRGRGRALVGDRVHDLAAFDLVEIPPRTWHQFHADQGESLGFLCMVNRDRDRPHRPDESERAKLLRAPHIAEFVRF